MKGKVTKHHWLKACQYLGIHPTQIVAGHLDISVIYFTQNCYCELISGEITVETGPNGYMDMPIESQIVCPTCMTILRKPERQLAGISECCHRLYCNQPKCLGGDLYCPICTLPVCRYCGHPIPGMGPLLFHKNDCKTQMLEYLYSLDPDDPYPLVKSSLSEAWNRRRMER